MWSSDRTKALVVTSCVKGWQHSLNVPSMYHVLALFNLFNCCSVANTRWRLSRTRISFWRNPAGMCSSCRTNSRSVGSFGLWRCRNLFASLAKFAGFGRLGHGRSSILSRKTSSTIADAGLNGVGIFRVEPFELSPFELSPCHALIRQGLTRKK